MWPHTTEIMQEHMDGRLYAVILLVSAHNEQLQLSTIAYKNAAELK